LRMRIHQKEAKRFADKLVPLRLRASGVIVWVEMMSALWIAACGFLLLSSSPGELIFGVLLLIAAS